MTRQKKRSHGHVQKSLAHQETELHPQAGIKGDQEEIEGLGMKLLGEVEQRGRHPLGPDEKNGGKKRVKQELAVLTHRPRWCACPAPPERLGPEMKMRP